MSLDSLKSEEDGAKHLKYKDGWHKYNPNNVKCDCGSSDVEFLWDNGRVVGFHCHSCGDTELSK